MNQNIYRNIYYTRISILYIQRNAVIFRKLYILRKKKYFTSIITYVKIRAFFFLNLTFYNARYNSPFSLWSSIEWCHLARIPYPSIIRYCEWRGIKCIFMKWKAAYSIQQGEAEPNRIFYLLYSLFRISINLFFCIYLINFVCHQ